jgi:cysteine synthase A
MQGWTPDFIPKITNDATAAHLYDDVLTVDGPEALRMSRELAQKEGLLVGISAGATFAGALKVAAKARPGATILAMLPDTGERYLSTPLFGDVPAEMTPEEIEIFKSTPMFADALEPA